VVVQEGVHVRSPILGRDATHAILKEPVDHHAIEVRKASELDCGLVT